MILEALPNHRLNDVFQNDNSDDRLQKFTYSLIIKYENKIEYF